MLIAVRAAWVAPSLPVGIEGLQITDDIDIQQLSNLNLSNLYLSNTHPLLYSYNTLPLYN